MRNQERTYYYLLGALVFIFLLVQLIKPRPLDWSESFSATDKIPYGGYIIQNLLPGTFPGSEVAVNSSPLFEYEDTTESPENWIFINREFGLDQWETEILLNEVRAGDNVFIAARDYSNAFADTLNLETRFSGFFLDGNDIMEADTSYVNFTNPQLKKEKGWPFVQNIMETYFTSVDTNRTVLLGVNMYMEPNFVRVNHGEGNIYLHTNPTLFTNYFVRDSIGADYAQRVLSHLPVREVIWDEYYKPGSITGGSAVRYVVSQEHLKWAWFIALSGVVLFMIFRAKRSQRVIPVIDPPKNSSIEFAKTIGSLYLEKGNHKLIAEKKVTFFLDYIRSHLNLDTSEVNNEFKKDVSLRSGISEDEIHQLFDLIELTAGKEQISETELKLLTEGIDRFYNKSSR